MMAFSSENWSLKHSFHQRSQALSGNCLLVLILLGKILLNAVTLGMRRKHSCQTLMGYFCTSLAIMDLLLLVSVCTLSCFRDFVLLGVRFTRYHICLLMQIISCAYSFLHYPVFIAACIDYHLSFSTSASLSFKCQRLLYISAVLLIWVSVLAYVLGDPVAYQNLKIQNVNSDQCPFHTGIQSYWLSFSMVTVLFLALITSWSEVTALVQALRIASHMNETVLYFPLSSHSVCNANSKKALLPKFLVCFLGTWLPFVLLQVIILLLKVQIPAYIAMNTPWLYFVNSFLIAAVYWFNCHKLNLRAIVSPVDPFINWKCCFIPLTMQNLEQSEKPMSISVY